MQTKQPGKKALLFLALCLMLLLSLIGCSSQEKTPEKFTAAPQNSPAPTVAEKKTATLYTNMETGNESAEWKEHKFEYSGELTAKVLADGLTQLTGLDFFIDTTEKPDGITVDWAKNSTLISNLDDRVQKDEFHFFDSESMRWFMMDSLWRTITENLKAENVYFTTDGGKELAFEELYPVKVFPQELPYMGSAFFFAHADSRGDLTEVKPVSDDEAFNLVLKAMKQRGENATTLVQTGRDTINGEQALTFAAGENSADGSKFTAMYHYAVTDSGNVYYRDTLQGADWILLEMNA